MKREDIPQADYTKPVRAIHPYSATWREAQRELERCQKEGYTGAHLERVHMEVCTSRMRYRWVDGYRVVFNKSPHDKKPKVRRKDWLG